MRTRQNGKLPPILGVPPNIRIRPEDTHDKHEHDGPQANGRGSVERKSEDAERAGPSYHRPHQFHAFTALGCLTEEGKSAAMGWCFHPSIIHGRRNGLLAGVAYHVKGGS